MHPYEAHNIRIVEELDEVGLENILVASFSNLREIPVALQFLDESETAKQFSSLYVKLNYDVQGRFRIGLKGAISRWQLNTKSFETAHDSLEVLFQLVGLASMINLHEVAPTLIGLINRGVLLSISENERDRIAYRILSTLVNVVEFDTKTIQPFFERSFYGLGNKYNNGLDYRYAHQLFVGLCKANSDGWVDYLLNFIRIVEKHPEYKIPLKLSLAKFAEIVGLYGVRKHLDKLSKPDLNTVFNYICRQSWSPFSFEEYRHGESTLRGFIRNSPVLVRAVYLIYNPKLSFGYDEQRFILYDELDSKTTRYLNAIYPNLSNINISLGNMADRVK